MISGLNKLETINFEGCSDLQNNTLESIADTCQFLKVLNLKNCRYISVHSLGDVTNSCQNVLERLNIGGCDWILDWILHENCINYVAVCKNLTHIEMNDCRQLFDDDLTFIAQNLKNLKAINITGCYNISDEGIIKISHLIKAIKVFGCDKITDAGVLFASSNQKSLIEELAITCGYTENITYFGIRDTVKNSKHLKVLKIQNDGGLTKRETEELVKEFRNEIAIEIVVIHFRSVKSTLNHYLKDIE
jgi:F-box/leucine-rich repeat protein 2/20